ncbi:MAG: serine hydrolase [Candidatus Acidiferrum sp.]|jgi:beta-lactamase class A
MILQARKTAAAISCLLLFLSLPPASSAQAAATSTPAALQERLSELAATFPGKVGFYVRNVETGATVAINPDETYPMASTYKVAIMTEVFRQVDAGKISLDERVTLKQSDLRLGSGLFMYFKPGLAPTIHDLLLLMIVVSDNEATDLLLNRVGAANVTATLRTLGIQNIRVDRTTEQIISDWLAAGNPVYSGKTAAELIAHPDAFPSLTQAQMDKAGQTLTDDPRDHTSPRAMAQLLEKIVKSEAASEKSCVDMLGIMQKQEHRGRISRYMGDMTTATKSGTIGLTTNDVGVLYVGKQHVVVTVFTVKAGTLVPTDVAEDVIGRIARTSYDYFNAISASH